MPEPGARCEKKQGPLNFYGPEKPKIALVLAGGGSRGFAHVGVIKALEREGIVPDIVVGTSMGSVVGGFYAAGIPCDELERLALSINWDDLFRDTPLRSDKFLTQKKGEESHQLAFRFNSGRIVIPTALNAGHNIINLFLDKTLGADYRAGFNFDSLGKQYRALATDLVNARRVVLKEGCLAEAIRASMAVPFLFTPFTLDRKMLVDGGFMNILPVDVARDMGADVIIAVDVKPVLATEEELRNPISFIDQVVAICLTNQSTLPGLDSATRITPDLARHGSADYSDVASLIASGERAATEKIPDILRKIRAFRPQPPAETLRVQVTRINGLERTPNAAVSEALQIEAGRPVTASGLRDAAWRLYRTGYFDSVRFATTAMPSGVSLAVTVKERMPVQSITFRNNMAFSEAELEELFPIKAGMPANPVLIREGGTALETAYAEKGFPLARIAGIDELGGNFEITVDEGRIGRIDIVGNEKTDESVILREISLFRGKPFSAQQAAHDIRNLYATGLFDYAYFNLSHGDSGAVLTLHVREKPSEVFRIGARYDNVRMLEGFLGFQSLNFARRGMVLNSILHYGLRREKYLLGLRSDRLLHTFLSMDAKAYYYRDRKYVTDPDDSTRFTFNTLRKIGTHVSLAHQILKMGTLSYVFYLEHYKSNQDNSSLGPIKNYMQGLRVVSLRSEFDTYDHPDFPKTGFTLFASTDFGLDIIGQHDAFFKTTLTSSGAISPSRRHTFLPSLYLTMSDVALPDPVRNYLGGATELRMNDEIVFHNSFPLYGFPEQAFTGDYLMALRLAWRVNLWRNVYFTLIGNAGETWTTTAFKWTELSDQVQTDSYRGAGASLAVDIPKFGPVSVTAGLPLLTAEQKTRLKDQRWTLYVSLGHNF
ncbi:MAG: patatin-like phospholipase family protein [Fibrobacterota bacterium]